MNTPTVECLCGRSIRPENWQNHLVADSRHMVAIGPHLPFVSVPALTDEEARLLQRLDWIEENAPQRKVLRTRLVNRLTELAEKPDAQP